MNPTTLLDLVQKRLRVPLNDNNAQKFLSAEINGPFLYAAGQTDIFHQVSLPIGPSLQLAQLAKTIVASVCSFHLRLDFSYMDSSCTVKKQSISLQHALSHAHLPGLSFASLCPAPFKSSKYDNVDRNGLIDTNDLCDLSPSLPLDQ
jgi:hypothetical protein